MPVLICPRCKHFNPEYAVYCHFDGVVLQAQQSAAPLRLPNDFMFPSGRRCRTFDELAQGCQEEWSAARDLLMRGAFAQFFTSCNRADLVRAANDARAQPNSDIGLTTFVGALPGIRTQTPKLDLNPRRILLGTLLVGDTKTVPLTVTNQGQGMLQGTVSVAEGQDWLEVGDKPGKHEVEVNTAREQVVRMTIKTKGQAAGQTYKAKLTVVTNGGVVEVPLRMELAAQPFAKAPFQGARSQRELAEKMRAQPKQAVPILESGEVQRWFELNGWNYPVRGTPIKGIGGVQQFFEGMGVSKPPVVNLSKSELHFTVKYKDASRGQVTLQTPAKKWVYARITSDSPWLKPTQSQVSGPQHAAVAFEIDTNLWNQGPKGEGKLLLEANGGQKLSLKVALDVPGAPAATRPRPITPAPITTSTTSAPTPAPIPTAPIAGPTPAMSPPTGGGRLLPSMVTTVLLCLALRVILIPFVDFMLRPNAAAAAATKLKVQPTPDAPFSQTGGWLRLPWMKILSTDTAIPAKEFQPANEGDLSTSEFRHYFIHYFMRWFVIATAWIGAIVGAIVVLRRGGGALDVPWGIVAGLFAGLAGSASLAAFFLTAEFLPLALWQLVFGPQSGFGYLLLFELLAVFCWLIIGVAVSFILPWTGPLRQLLVDPFQAILASILRVVGGASLGQYWAPA